MSYIFLKYIPIFCVAASFAFFFMRGLWMVRGYPEPQEGWVRALPPITDGVLLLAAVGLIAVAPAWGWSTWINVKFLMIAIYVVLALVVFRDGGLRWVKGVLWGFALLLFLQIRPPSQKSRAGCCKQRGTLLAARSYIRPPSQKSRAGCCKQRGTLLAARS